MDDGILESTPNLLALGLGQVDLDLVRMTGSQLDSLVAEGVQLLEDGGEVPILGDIVGDDPELRHGRSPFSLESPFA